MKWKHLTETLVCPRERLVIISYTTDLSFAQERIGPFSAIIITIFYLLVLYLFALPNTPKNLFASIYSESLIKTACQHLLFLVGFDTLIYRKYYDTPSILVVHHTSLRRWPWWCRRPLVGIPLSGRVPGRAPGSSRSRDGDDGGLQYVSWKRDPSLRFFPSRGTYRRKGIVRGGASWPHHGAARPVAGPRPPCGEPSSWPPSVSSSVCAKLR
jgi:hypothetical protein